MPCLFRFLFHYPCPACGVTRALCALCHKDFASYAYYNIMAVPLCFAVILVLVGIKFKRKLLEYLGIFVLFSNLPYYFFRVVFAFVP